MTDLSRRHFLSFAPLIVAAPAIVRASSLMKVRAIPVVEWGLVRPAMPGTTFETRMAGFTMFQWDQLPSSITNQKAMENFFRENAAYWNKRRQGELVENIFGLGQFEGEIGAPAI